MKKVRIGIIGFGKRGRIHAEVWSKISNADLMAVADPEIDKRREAEKLYGCKTFKSGKEMVSELPLDIAVIATRAAKFYRNVTAALSSGINVVCEKPFAVNLKQANRMVALAKKNKLLLGVGYEMIFSDSVKRLEKLLKSGAIGKVKFVSGCGKGRPAPYDLMEIGGHILHLTRHLMGHPKTVFGIVTKNGRDVSKKDFRPLKDFYKKGYDTGFGAGDHILGIYKFENGITLVVRFSDSESISHEYMATEFHGTKGRLRLHQTGGARLFVKNTPFDDFKTLNKWREVNPGKIWPRDVKWRKATTEFAKDFIRALGQKRKSKVSGEDARDVLEMMLGIYASHLQERPLTLPLKTRLKV